MLCLTLHILIPYNLLIHSFTHIRYYSHLGEPSIYDRQICEETDSPGNFQLSRFLRRILFDVEVSVLYLKAHVLPKSVLVQPSHF